MAGWLFGMSGGWRGTPGLNTSLQASAYEVNQITGRESPHRETPHSTRKAAQRILQPSVKECHSQKEGSQTTTIKNTGEHI
jgi:hypothetical protein